MCRSADGWRESEAVRTSAESVSVAPCRGSRTSSCPSWTSRQAQRFPPEPSAHMAARSRCSAPSLNRPSTKNRSGVIRGPNLPPAITHDPTDPSLLRGAIEMSTITAPTKEAATKGRNLVEMNWDPITRIVGSLGIFTKIDFANRQVAECHSTSSIFRGYSIFMKGKDPRDAHFITSRICGICGDNHATCATYAQNMAFGVRPPAIAEWIVNLGEAAEYMFDHNIFQDNLVGVDFCEQMVKETNPSVFAKAEKTAAPHANAHGYRTIGDIMKALNPFTGSFYIEALQVSRMTREMFCLMEGRHVHPSTLYPGGVGTVPTVQLFTDYIVRLMKYVEFMN